MLYSYKVDNKIYTSEREKISVLEIKANMFYDYMWQLYIEYDKEPLIQIPLTDDQYIHLSMHSKFYTLPPHGF